MRLKIDTPFYTSLIAIGLLINFTSSQDCIPDGRISPGDGIDNDCDGLIDEEYCYNGIDEDKDGKMNEDCAALPTCERHGSSLGREFVGAFIENGPDQWLNAPVEMLIARAEPSADYAKWAPITAHVQTPLYVKEDKTPSPFNNMTVTIDSASAVAKMILPGVPRLEGTSITNKGYIVRTNGTTAIYGYNKECYTSDSFLQLPANSLGTDYYAITYQPSARASEMAIVGLYSDTIVTVTLLPDTGDTDIPRLEMEWAGKTYTNGDKIRIRLQPFEVAQFQAEYDLTGTHVVSSLPVAFFSGNVRTWVRDETLESAVRTRDHLVEQVPPTDTWGRQFVTQNYPPHKGEDLVYIVASQPDTVINLFTMNPPSDKEEKMRFKLPRPGMSYRIHVKPNSRISIGSSKPVMVAQLTHSQMTGDVPKGELTDPSLIYVVPVTQFDKDYLFGTTDNANQISNAFAPFNEGAKDSFTNYVILTAREGAEASIMINGQPVDDLPERPRWRPISLRGNQTTGEQLFVRYFQTYIAIPEGVHRLTSSPAHTFGAVHWAVADRNTFAHPLGIRWKKDDCQICRQIVCGDGVDNDCDGQIDEEKCDGLDNDGDGLVDEDCNGNTYQGCVPIRPRRTTTISSTTSEATTEATDSTTEMSVTELTERSTTQKATSAKMSSTGARSSDGTTSTAKMQSMQTSASEATVAPTSATCTIQPYGSDTFPMRTVPLRSAQICYGTSETLTCEFWQKIVIITANYGRISYEGEKTCGMENPLSCDAVTPACPYLDVYNATSLACDGRQLCSVSVKAIASSDQLSRLPLPCKPKATYVDVSYLCIDNMASDTACSFTPASRLLRSANEFRLSSSSFASCPACKPADPGKTGSQNTGDEKTFCFNATCPSKSDDCRPEMATFDHSAVEAWCPSLLDKGSPSLTADLGASYVVLGVVLQGRRRYLSQYVTDVVVHTSMDGKNYESVPHLASFSANTNATQLTWLYFETSSIIARYVRVQVVSFAQHPALHLEVIIDKHVSGCEPFRGNNTSMYGKRGAMGIDFVVYCINGTRTVNGRLSYTSRCKADGKWSVERSCTSEAEQSSSDYHF